MRECDNPHQPKPWVFILAGFLTVGNALAALFGCAMLAWTLEEMQNKGEQWGFLVIMFFSFISLPVMLLLLLPGTILMATLARRRLAAGFRALLVVMLAAGLLANAAAIMCIPLSQKARTQALKSERPVYTSGLYDAVKQGDTASVESILTSNPNAICDIPLDMSLLARAVSNNDQAMVELLLKHGADAKSGGGGRPSPLHIAAERGNVPIAKILLEHGADINAEDSDTQQQTPLTYAQRAGRSAMVQFLKSKGASTVNLKDAAWRAVYCGRISELRGILDRGFDVNEAWASGTLLHTAAEQGNMEMAKMLIDRGARLDTSLGLGTPLHDAAYEGKAEMIRYLINRGANPNALEKRNYSPLYWAAVQGHLEAVRALLDNGADPNIGESAIKETKRQGHTDVVALLIQRGAKEQASTSPAGSQ